MGRCLKIASLVIHWLFLGLTIVLLVSGLGISYARQVERLTFGLLNKAIAFKLHDVLWIPFLGLLSIHLLLVIIIKRVIQKQNDAQSDEFC